MTSILGLFEIACAYAPIVFYALGLVLALAWLKAVSNGEASMSDYACVIIWPVVVAAILVFLLVAIPARGAYEFWRLHHPFIAWHPVMYGLSSYQRPLRPRLRNAAGEWVET